MNSSLEIWREPNPVDSLSYLFSCPGPSPGATRLYLATPGRGGFAKSKRRQRLPCS
jgi:hypothetical protein